MKITLHLTVEEVNSILQGLAELPAKTSMTLIQRIHDEASEQLKSKPTFVNQENDGDYTTTEEVI